MLIGLAQNNKPMRILGDADPYGVNNLAGQKSLVILYLVSEPTLESFVHYQHLPQLTLRAAWVRLQELASS